MFGLSLASCSAVLPSKDARSGARHPESRDVVVQAERLTELPTSVLEALGGGLAIEAVFALSSENDFFGGLSGLWLDADSTRLIAVSDIGQRWHAQLRHDQAGRLIGIEEDWSVADLPLGAEDGAGTRWIDSEALAEHGADGLVVAYEGHHRLHRWPADDLGAVPTRLPLPNGLGGPSNSGIEALATLPDGRLFAIAEGVGAWGGEGLMGWVIDQNKALDLIYVPGPGLAPTGADRLDDTVYVVERRFSLFGGFQTRIVTLPVNAIQPGTKVTGTELAAFRWGDLGENFEGIAARQGPDGRIFLYLLADDNFSFLQQTLLVQLSLQSGSETAGPPVN